MDPMTPRRPAPTPRNTTRGCWRRAGQRVHVGSAPKPLPRRAGARRRREHPRVALEVTAGHSSMPGAITSTGGTWTAAARDNAYFAAAGARRHRGMHPRRRTGSQPGRHAGQPPGPPMSAMAAHRGPASAGDIAAGPQHPCQQPAIPEGGRAKKVVPDEDNRLKRGEDGCSVARKATRCPPCARLQDGALEGSNVNPDGGDGRNDRRGPPVRGADAHAAERRNQRQDRQPAAQPERLPTFPYRSTP